MRTKTDTTGSHKALLDWLMANGRDGQPRVRRLGWGRLARIYHARQAGRKVRQAIEREARRCGYTPAMVLGLNRWN